RRALDRPGDRQHSPLQRTSKPRRVALGNPDGPWNSVAANRGCAIAPYARDRSAARRAFAIFQAVGRDAETVTADDHLVAIRAVRSLAIAERTGDIAGIDVTKAGALADLVGAQQMMRPRRFVLHLVILVIRGDVPRNVDVDLGKELCDFRQLLIRIVEAGN